MGRAPVWLWLNLLSLDAPLVALVWQDFLARCYPALLLPAGRCVLALTVWVIYIADKLLDLRGTGFDAEALHHRFYRAHRRLWIAVLANVVAADLFITILWLRPAVFVHGLAVAGASIFYLAVFTGEGTRRVYWKKAAAAVLFSSGVFLVSSANSGDPVQRLILPWLAFAVLCAGNLVVIQQWKLKRGTRGVRFALAAFAVLCAIIGRAPWYQAVASSALALAAIDSAGRKISGEARRVLADFALLTPLLLR